MKLRRRVLSAGMAVALTASVGVISAAGNALAYDASYMNKRELQQAVLRAHPGVQLGAWTQNFYFNDFIPMKPCGLPLYDQEAHLVTEGRLGGVGGLFHWQGRDRFHHCNTFPHHLAVQECEILRLPLRKNSRLPPAPTTRKWNGRHRVSTTSPQVAVTGPKAPSQAIAPTSAATRSPQTMPIRA